VLSMILKESSQMAVRGQQQEITGDTTEQREDIEPERLAVSNFTALL